MARLFTIKKHGDLDPNIKPTKINNEYFLTTGETGRGRKMSLARFPGPEPLSYGNLSLSKGQLISVTMDTPPEPGAEFNLAAVLIKDQSGYRGSWQLHGHAIRPCSMPEWKPRSHAEKMEEIRKWDAANPSPDDSKEWDDYFNRRETFLFSLNGPACAIWAQKNPRTSENKDQWTTVMFPLRCNFDPSKTETRRWAEIQDSTCPDCGVVFESFGQTVHQTVKSEPPRVILEGYCAQGDAGRMGGGPEYVILLPKDSGFLITRTGRLYGGESWLNYWWDGRALKVESPSRPGMKEAVARLKADDEATGGAP